MKELFITFLPYILAAYFIFRSYKEPVYIMGIPFLMFLGPSIFFEKAVLFVIPLRSFASISQIGDLFLLTWLIICWIIFRIRTKTNSDNVLSTKHLQKQYNILDYYIVGLVIITCVGLGIVLKDYYLVDNVFDKFFVLIALFLGFFILKDAVRHTNTVILEDFFFNIVIINTLASGLYFIHQGLHIELYSTYSEYHSEVVDGEVITRTFWFMPVLWFFSISYLLVFKQKHPLVSIIMLAINILGIYISYTRSFIMNAAMIFFLYFLLTSYKSKNILVAIRGLLIIGFASIVLFLAVSSFLPSSTKYFLSRFDELDNRKPATAQSNNLLYRFFKTDRVMSKMDTEKVLFGYGSVTETQSPFVKFVNQATADMGWAEVIFRWGYLGLALFILLYIGSLIKAFFLFMRSEGILSHLALVLLLTIVSQVIESFTSWTFMSPNRSALGLWYFGILSALLLAHTNKEKLRNIEDENNEN